MKKALKRLDNKGFTLVELIIVIAIIAVLAAVIAPQYIKYVERSRQSTDANAVAEIAHAAEVAYVGDGTTQPSTTSFSFTCAKDMSTTTYSDQATAGTLAAAVSSVTPASSYNFKSTLYVGKTIYIVITNGKATWGSTAPTDGVFATFTADNAPNSSFPTKAS